MNAIPLAEHFTSSASFDDIQANGNTTTISKCKNCNYITSKNNFYIWKHWKYHCPYKLLFKYSSRTSPNGGINGMICLVCNGQFDRYSISFMTSHRSVCTNDRLLSASKPNEVEQRVRTTDHDYFANSMVAAKTPARSNNTDAPHDPINDRHLVATAPSYTIEPSSVDNGLRFSIRKTNTLNATEDDNCAECQMCKSRFVTDPNRVLRYCKQCVDGQPEIDDPNVLICVQTVPSECLNEQQENAHASVDITDDDPICFICNTARSDSFVDLYGTTTTETKTSIYDYIWKLLDGQPSSRNDSTDASSLGRDMVCAECLAMINEYDLARFKVKVFKKKLRDRLTKTEVYYTGLRNEKNAKQNDGGDNDKDEETMDSPQSPNPECQQSSSEVNSF